MGGKDCCHRGWGITRGGQRAGAAPPARRRRMPPLKVGSSQLWQTGWGRVMSAASDPILNEVVRRLVEAYSPERIYLFGSVARGEAGPASDYEIMFIVTDEAPPRGLRSGRG